MNFLVSRALFHNSSSSIARSEAEDARQDIYPAGHLASEEKSGSTFETKQPMSRALCPVNFRNEKGTVPVKRE